MLAFVTTILYSVLKTAHSGCAMVCKLLCVVSISLFSLQLMHVLTEQLYEVVSFGQEQIISVKLITQLFGIGFLCDLCATLAREEGLASIASQLELFGKLSIFAIAWPVVNVLLNTMQSMF